MGKPAYRDYEADKGKKKKKMRDKNKKKKSDALPLRRYLLRAYLAVFFSYTKLFVLFAAKFTDFLQNFQAPDGNNRNHAKYAVQLTKLAHREQVTALMF